MTSTAENLTRLIYFSPAAKNNPSQGWLKGFFTTWSLEQKLLFISLSLLLHDQLNIFGAASFFSPLNFCVPISEPFSTPTPEPAWFSQSLAGVFGSLGAQGSSAHPAGHWALSPCAGRVEESVATPRAVHHGPDSVPGINPAAGVGSALGWCWQPLACAPVCTCSLLCPLPFSFYLFTDLLLPVLLPAMLPCSSHFGCSC